MDNVKLKEVCKIGSGPETCRYIVVGANGFECAKNKPSLSVIIDSRLKQGTLHAQGDNCEKGGARRGN